jgi:hypothetical protein
MSRRADRLEQRARETARTPRPERLAPGRRGYRAISISLYLDQLAFVDALTVRLEAAGYPKANRSLVVQEAIEQLRLLLETRGLEDADDVATFLRDEAAARRRRPLRKTS